jgi:hypothetical protein
MPSKTFSVTNYTLNIGYKNTAGFGAITIQIQGVLVCYGADRSRFVVYGLHPASPVPASPFVNLAINSGAIFVPFSELHHYVDIVRNEKPVFATLNSDIPDFMALSTTQEPVGEQEGV